MLTKKGTVVCCILVSCALVVGVLFLRRQGHFTDGTGERQALATPSATQSDPSWARGTRGTSRSNTYPLSDGWRSLSATRSEEDLATEEGTTAEEEVRTELERDMYATSYIPSRSAFAESRPHVKEFFPEIAWLQSVRGKMLKRQKDKDALIAFMSSEDLLQKAKSVFDPHSELGLSNIGEHARTAMLDIIADAAALEDNPMAAQLATLIEKIILSKLPSEPMSAAQRRSIIGDRLQLAYIYEETSPEAFAQFKSHHAEEERIAGFLAYAAKNRSRLRATR